MYCSEIKLNKTRELATMVAGPLLQRGKEIPQSLLQALQLPGVAVEDLGRMVARLCGVLIPAIFYPRPEIDWGLFWAAFVGSEGKHLFHRIG